jgi:hypothetical protein
MGCSCNKKRQPIPPKAPPPPTEQASQRASFTLHIPGQPSSSFDSKLEADAANARSGGVGVVLSK